MNQQPNSISNATTTPASHAELVRELHRLEAKLNAMRRWALGAVVVAVGLGAASFAMAAPRSASFDSLTLRELHFVDAESSADPSSPLHSQVTGLNDLSVAKLVAADVEIQKDGKVHAALRATEDKGVLQLKEGGDMLTMTGTVLGGVGTVVVKATKIGQN